MPLPPDFPFASIITRIYSAEWQVAIFNAFVASLFAVVGLVTLYLMEFFSPGFAEMLNISINVGIFLAVLIIHPEFYKVAKRKNKTERKMAMIFIGPVVGFLAGVFYAIFLDIYRLVMDVQGHDAPFNIIAYLSVGLFTAVVTSPVSIVFGVLLCKFNFAVIDRMNSEDKSEPHEIPS